MMFTAFAGVQNSKGYNLLYADITQHLALLWMALNRNRLVRGRLSCNPELNFVKSKDNYARSLQDGIISIVNVIPSAKDRSMVSPAISPLKSGQPSVPEDHDPYLSDT